MKKIIFSKTGILKIAATLIIIAPFGIKIAQDGEMETNKVPPPVPPAIERLLSKNGESGSFLYDVASRDPAFQKQWINQVLRKYNIQDRFADIVIITPQNAGVYGYDLAKPPSHTQLFLTSPAFKIGDFGTQRVPYPALYMPSDSFAKTKEGDLEKLIAFHMAKHVNDLRNGFDLGGRELFKYKANPDSYSLPMLDAVLELDALYKDQIEKSPKRMSEEYLESQRDLYMSHYIQIWMHSPSIKDDVAKMLKARYFLPWMMNANSIRVSEEVREREGIPEKWIIYGGRSDKPFIVAEMHNGVPAYMIQLQIQNGQAYNTIKLPLPKGLP